MPHYWIVDNAERSIAQYSLAGKASGTESYGPATLLYPGDTLTSPFFPTLSVPVAWLFRNVRDRRRSR